MDKRGQISSLGFSVLVALMLFMIGMVTVNLLMPSIDQTRIDLSCSSPTAISDGIKVTCLLVDGVMPYFIVLVLSTAGGFVTNKLLI